jgi:hypothetical protein
LAGGRKWSDEKLRALMNDPAATAGERAAARERIAAIKNPGRGMSDAELAATIARLKDERAAIPIPHDVERRRKEKREEIERYEHERNKRYKKKLKAMADEEVAAAAARLKRLKDVVDARTRLEGERPAPEEDAAEDR